MKKKVLQIIDANLNRAREGLRVCEDIARFTVPRRPFAGLLKMVRHNTTKAILSSKDLALKGLLKSRDTKNDRMKSFDFKKPKGSALSAIFMANIERTKESLRVLEECSKIIDEPASRKFRKLRFAVYDIEKGYYDTIENC